ncbi:MAG: hypothetical protein IT166_22825, partial [Bryobacterales bacterium]|nr:hypothetical protein [Bryobacterales bacterium]
MEFARGVGEGEQEQGNEEHGEKAAPGEEGWRGPVGTLDGWGLRGGLGFVSRREGALGAGLAVAVEVAFGLFEDAVVAGFVIVDDVEHA